MQKKDKLRIILEIFLLIVFLGIFIYLLKEHAPKIFSLLTSGNASQLDDYIEQHGTEGKYLLILLQIIETISIVLPATPVYICCGIVFGKLWGTLVCYGLNLLLNLIIFLIAKKMKDYTKSHYDITKQKFIGPLIDKAKHMDRVVIVMCLLPVIPSGLIPYMSSQTKITVPEFMRALAIGSFPAIALYVCCGDFITSASYKIFVPVVIILLILAIIAYIFRKKLISSLEPKIVKFIEG